MLLEKLHPKNIVLALDAIDQMPESYRLSRQATLRRVMLILSTVAISLLIINYLKNSGVLREILYALALDNDLPKRYYLNAVFKTGFGELVSYAWWTFWHIVGYVLIPIVIIKIFLKERIRDFGLGFGQTKQHWFGYVLLVSPILCFVVLVSFREDFSSHYPFYSQAGRSWLDFILWECLYITQFICLEFFFRGFVLRSLQPAMGANAIWVMCVPYLMIHFPKLWLEATGAFLFGLFLGILAIRSRSIWGGVAVHVGIAVLMDVTALIQRGAFFK